MINLDKIDVLELRMIMRIHAICSLVIGIFCICLPHAVFIARNLPVIFSNEMPVGSYNHTAHEFVRLYGCFSLTLGYVVERCKTISDGMLIRIFTEAFCICYGLQCLVMIKAHVGYPQGHPFPYFHISAAIVFGAISLMYGFIRFFKKTRQFELPTTVFGRDD